MAVTCCLASSPCRSVARKALIHASTISHTSGLPGSTGAVKPCSPWPSPRARNYALFHQGKAELFSYLVQEKSISWLFLSVHGLTSKRGQRVPMVHYYHAGFPATLYPLLLNNQIGVIL